METTLRYSLVKWKGKVDLRNTAIVTTGDRLIRRCYVLIYFVTTLLACKEASPEFGRETKAKYESDHAL